MSREFVPGPRAAAILQRARATEGFMPDDEGMALCALARALVLSSDLPSVVVEIGAYCGRSTLYLAAGAADALDDLGTEQQGVGRGSRAALFSVDHHHGSEENQPGWEHHDPRLVDPRTGQMDTLPIWRAAVDGAGVADIVVGIVGDSPSVAAQWGTPAGLVFIDGGHGSEPAWADYRGWAPRVATGAFLAIHDVFENPAEGGRPPYEIYCRALESGSFTEEPELGRGSLRVLRRVGEGE